MITIAVTRRQTRIGSTRLTKNWKRKRLASPSSFIQSSFKTIDIGGGKKMVIGQKKSNKEWTPQALLTPRKKRKKK